MQDILAALPFLMACNERACGSAIVCHVILSPLSLSLATHSFFLSVCGHSLQVRVDREKSLWTHHLVHRPQRWDQPGALLADSSVADYPGPCGTGCPQALGQNFPEAASNRCCRRTARPQSALEALPHCLRSILCDYFTTTRLLESAVVRALSALKTCVKHRPIA